MSRSGQKSWGQVLRVDQKKWPPFKTDKQKKNEMILKKNVIWMNILCFYTKHHFFFLPKKKGEYVPLATGAYASDKIR
jgi:hypothetical protein